MKQPPDWPFFCKPVVELRRLSRRKDMRFDPLLFQEIKGFASDPQTFGHPSDGGVRNRKLRPLRSRPLPTDFAP